MHAPLKLFTDPAILARVQRHILTRFLEDCQEHLPPDAAALLKTSLNSLTFEEYCTAWAAQFGSTAQFGAPLLDALYAVEFLAQPENASILAEALSHLPPGTEINRGFSTLHQALHLWMLAQSPAGIVWPSDRGASDREECGADAAVPLSTLNLHSPLRTTTRPRPSPVFHLPSSPSTSSVPSQPCHPSTVPGPSP